MQFFFTCFVSLLFSCAVFFVVARRLRYCYRKNNCIDAFFFASSSFSSFCGVSVAPFVDAGVYYHHCCCYCHGFRLPLLLGPDHNRQSQCAAGVPVDSYWCLVPLVPWHAPFPFLERLVQNKHAFDSNGAWRPEWWKIDCHWCWVVLDWPCSHDPLDRVVSQRIRRGIIWFFFRRANIPLFHSRIQNLHPGPWNDRWCDEIHFPDNTAWDSVSLFCQGLWWVSQNFGKFWDNRQKRAVSPRFCWVVRRSISEESNNELEGNIPQQKSWQSHCCRCLLFPLCELLLAPCNGWLYCFKREREEIELGWVLLCHRGDFLGFWCGF